MLLGAGAALAGAALMGPAVASADGNDDEQSRPPLPAPSPIASVIAPALPLHVHAPGPSSITLPFSGTTLEGPDFEPSVMTDFKGFSALVYPVGTARGSDGKQYNLEGDMRVYSGTYVPQGSTTPRKGTFGLV
jgi:hypothetical protein